MIVDQELLPSETYTYTQETSKKTFIFYELKSIEGNQEMFKTYLITGMDFVGIIIHSLQGALVIILVIYAVIVLKGL